MSLKRETPCDYGECPYSASYSCGESEPADDPELWDEGTQMQDYWEAVEVCPYCDGENTYPYWDTEKQGYIATCSECGKKLFLCDECLHADDNPNMECDWHETLTGRKCFRGEIIE